MERVVLKTIVPTQLRSDRSEQGTPSANEAGYVSDALRQSASVIEPNISVYKHRQSQFLGDSSTNTLDLSLVHGSTEATAADPHIFKFCSSRALRQQL